MKKLIFLLVSFLSLFSIKICAQSDISLEGLQMPSSPGFELLDVAPTLIDRPTTTKAFTTSILNSISENNGFPENYAIDFAPFWFFKHKNLNALNYWGINKSTVNTSQTPFSQARFGNISIATAKTEIIKDTIGTTASLNNIAIGVRTTILQLRKKDDLDSLIALNKSHVEKLSKLMQNPFLTPNELILSIESDPDLKRYNEEIRRVLKMKPLFAIDFAAAGSWSFENNNFGTIKSNRMGAWLTFNFAQTLNKKKNPGQTNYIIIYAIARILNDNNYLDEFGNLSSATGFDSGGKIEFELQKLSLSYEYLWRANLMDNNQNTYRSSGLIKYRASDQILVIASFGRNFGDENNLITQIGINWGLNTKNQSVNIE